MAVKTVTLTVEAYDALAAVRKDGESFSEVVKRLAGPQIRLSSFAGAWRKLPAARLRAIKADLAKMDAQSAAKLERLGRRRADAESR